MSHMHENCVNTHITRHGASSGGQRAFGKCSSPSCIFKIRLTTCDLAYAKYISRLKLEVVFSKTYLDQVVSHGPESLGMCPPEPFQAVHYLPKPRMTFISPE